MGRSSAISLALEPLNFVSRQRSGSSEAHLYTCRQKEMGVSLSLTPEHKGSGAM